MAAWSYILFISVKNTSPCASLQGQSTQCHGALASLCACSPYPWHWPQPHSPVRLAPTSYSTVFSAKENPGHHSNVHTRFPDWTATDTMSQAMLWYTLDPSHGASEDSCCQQDHFLCTWWSNLSTTGHYLGQDANTGATEVIKTLTKLENTI